MTWKPPTLREALTDLLSSAAPELDQRVHALGVLLMPDPGGKGRPALVTSAIFVVGCRNCASHLKAYLKRYEGPPPGGTVH
jgi:hypothetical protein